MNVCRAYIAHTHIEHTPLQMHSQTSVWMHTSHCRPLQVSSSSSLPPFFFFGAFFLLRASEGWVGGQAQAERQRGCVCVWGGVSLPLFCCCWGERDREHIFIQKPLCSPIHTHTPLSPSSLHKHKDTTSKSRRC